MNVPTLGASITLFALVACPGTDPPPHGPGAPEEPKPQPTATPPVVPSPTTPMATPTR